MTLLQSQFIESDSEVLLLNDVKIEDQGWYTCLVESSDGMSTASAWLQIDGKIFVELPTLELLQILRIFFIKC